MEAGTAESFQFYSLPSVFVLCQNASLGCDFGSCRKLHRAGPVWGLDGKPCGCLSRGCSPLCSQAIPVPRFPLALVVPAFR